MAQITLSVAGEPAPVDLDAVTADQVAIVAGALGVSAFDLLSVAVMPDEPVEVRTVVALVAISMWQRDLPVDISWMSKRITLGTDVTVTVHDDTPVQPPTPAEVANAAAVIARAERANA